MMRVKTEGIGHTVGSAGVEEVQSAGDPVTTDRILTVPRHLTTDAVRAIPRTIRLEYARAVDSGATVVADVWRDGTAWSCRLADPAGNDLLRARLEAPGTDRR